MDQDDPDDTPPGSATSRTDSVLHQPLLSTHDGESASPAARTSRSSHGKVLSQPAVPEEQIRAKEGDGAIVVGDGEDEQYQQGGSKGNNIVMFRALLGESDPAWLTSDGRGVAWWSPAGIWFIFARLMLLVRLGFAMYVCVERNLVQRSLIETFFLDIPVLLSALSALAAATIFPRVPYEGWQQVLDDADIDKAGRRAVSFMSFWMLLGIATSVTYHVVCPSTDSGERFFFVFLNIAATCGTGPILSAIFMTLHIDIAHARKQTRMLTMDSRNQTLDSFRCRVDSFRRVRYMIHCLSKSWKPTLTLLAMVSLYNSISICVYLISWVDIEGARRDDDKIFNLSYDDRVETSYSGFELLHNLLVIQILQIKDAVMLFIFTFLSRIVNDEADVVVRELYQWDQHTGFAQFPGSEDPSRLDLMETQEELDDIKLQVLKQQILLEASNFTWINKQDGSGGGIQFRVLFIRWTTTRFRLLLLSSAVSFTYSVATRLDLFSDSS